MKRWTTWGAVRGCCGIAYQSRAAAERAIARDAAGCRSQGGYSDRRVAAIVGGRLYHDDAGTDPVWPSHGRGTGAVRFGKG